MAQSKSFIPANESKWFIALFDLYMRNLFRRRFKNILIAQHYQPSNKSRTIYYLNHTSWWDGLIPLLLNRKLFHQNARAMMEDKQMQEHRFFSKIGAFSVNPDNPRSAVQSLRYAVDSMQRPHSCLFIYPEGRIVPFSTRKPEFKNGLGWLTKQCPDCDLVPVGIYINSARHDKPELFIRIGDKTKPDRTDETGKILLTLEQELQSTLACLVVDAHNDLKSFTEL